MKNDIMQIPKSFRKDKGLAETVAKYKFGKNISNQYC